MKENIFVFDQAPDYLKRTTHLSIAAHQDDIEIMSFDGIAKCLKSDSLWFGGIVCTDGAGSSRVGEFSSYTDDQMKEVRALEQIEAAKIGKYSFVAQLGFPSSKVKTGDTELVNTIKNYLLASRPDVIYTHNPFDKHATHTAVFKATLAALLDIKNQYRPKQFFGCEVWRNLDWLEDTNKIALNLSGHEKIILKLLSVFKSQIAGGKRYDLATLGRMRANATYFESHHSDNAELLAFAIDLMPLIDQLTIDAFIKVHITNFEKSVSANLLR